VHDDFAKTRTLRFQFLPKPLGHVFNRRILQAFDIVQIGVIEHFHQRFHRVAYFGVIVNPPGFWIDIAFHRNFDLETVAMHTPAFVALRRVGQSLRRFKSEIFR